jgi:signal transduction histidine kinase
MSTAPAHGAGGARRRSPALRAYLISVVGIAVAADASGMAVTEGAVEQLLRASPWIAVLFLAEMFPIPLWRSVRISLGYPLVVLLAGLYDPVVVGALVFVGTGDPRELRGGSDLLRSLFNRAQVTAAGMVASLAFHALEPDRLGPLALGAAVAAALAHMAVNMSLVGAAARLDFGRSVGQVLRRLLLGGRWSFQAAYATIGLLGGLMAFVVEEMGAWALAGVVLPVLALRHLLLASRRLEVEEARLRREAERRAAERQREDDRRRHLQEVAAFLHDEIVPELTAAGLLIESAGRLAWKGGPETEAHVRSAVETAQTARVRVRSLIGDLLRGNRTRDLPRALRYLGRDLEEEHGVTVHVVVEPVDVPWPAQDVLFGVAREAARNGARHGGAGVIEIGLRCEGSRAVLTVSDDGAGFDPKDTMRDGNGHGFGVRIMRKRVENLGGRLAIVSAAGRGTVVTCEVPLERAHAQAASSPD